MNEMLLSNVYKAIRGDRTALRTLVERYRGVAYALAYRETHSFPRAQTVALRAWSKLAERLPSLADPEYFLELLAEAVRAAAPGTPVQPDDDKADAEHSILRTEKVQARRALRRALAECPRPEANAFFLRFVEGLSSEEIGELHGVEPAVAVEAQAAVCLDLAYRAGLAGGTGAVPAVEELPAERREAILLVVRQAESSLDDDGARRLSELVQTDDDVRREVGGARMVLSLAPATLAAHRLPTEFVREAMQGIPLIEPRVARTAPLPPPRPVSQEKGADASVVFSLGLGGFAIGLLVAVGLVNLFAPLFTGWPPSPLLMGIVAFTVPLGLLSLGLARPPLEPSPKWPLGYYLFYGVLMGAFGTFLGYEMFGEDTHRVVVWSGLAPVWSVLCLGLVGVRLELAMRSLEERIDAHFRRLETAVQAGPDMRTPTPAPTAEPPQSPA